MTTSAGEKRSSASFEHTTPVFDLNVVGGAFVLCLGDTFCLVSFLKNLCLVLITVDMAFVALSTS